MSSVAPVAARAASTELRRHPRNWLPSPAGFVADLAFNRSVCRTPSPQAAVAQVLRQASSSSGFPSSQASILLAPGSHPFA